ncbi:MULTISPECIES: porin [Pseudoxanthomonas]|uniref:OprO/OprP family phosphate-selective porin n=1 Tax=Pseudoxanthomonas TaxID=83618 RepID=UPI0016095D6F|nr:MULTISPECIES: porin [Pseudoxanthomonas]MBB3277453.1 phosphate-selective porin OprO/OprP [Pseudoxanthomonas sp. OG2]MBD9376355.1 porin [Pseudoxanthomonas sp. PXM04]MBV7474125.1 OprO/OprP family phosphate-selective porin [Pseudoxanthomonas sp. PXM05]UBB26301.1 OprO/OprP family phosphate-selective porin [Pseudoxanthomonas japonensis]
MKLSRSTLTLALLAAVAAPAAQAEIPIDVIGGSEVSFEGLVQADFYKFDTDTIDYGADSSSDLDGDDYLNELRRAELVLKGKGPGNIEWVLGYDAKDDKFLDANVKYKIGGNANHFLQIGQFKQPGATLEELSSTKNNDFISKSSITNSLGTPRRLGLQYNIGDANWGVTASFFGRELTRNREHGGGYSARGYWAPINEAGSILHLGLSYTDKDTDGDVIRLRARPMADMVPTRFVDTGSSGLRASDRSSVLGAEAMWVNGPFKLQGEYMKTDVKRYGSFDDYSGDGFYVSGLWNITGETWGYKAGVPTTGLPSDPTKGMWQLGLRYDTIDLTDGAVVGGEMDSWTAGVNWYWRSNFKFMLNYVAVKQEKGVLKDDPNVVEARLQFYW